MTDKQAILKKRLTLRGKIVKTRAELEKYKGWNNYPEPLRSWKKHNPNEPVIGEEFVLCAETAEYLYSKFTPTTVRYKKGSRPVLEGLLSECVLRGAPRPSDRELAFKTWEWVFENVGVRNNHVARKLNWTLQHRKKLLYFGNDEDVASFRSAFDCFCGSKLLVSMLQVAGIPARLIYIFHSDMSWAHTVSEAYFDEKWRFFDENAYFYAETRDGDVASMWEVLTDPYCWNEGLRWKRQTRSPWPPYDFGTIDSYGIANYPIADSTAHYRMATGSYWWDKDQQGAKRTARFGF